MIKQGWKRDIIIGGELFKSQLFNDRMSKPIIEAPSLLKAERINNIILVSYITIQKKRATRRSYGSPQMESA